MSDIEAACVRARADAVLLSVRLTPKASADAVIGIEDGPDGPVLKAKVRAIPDKGKANKALIKLMAGWLKVPQSSLSLSSGSKSRFKTVEISGDPEELTALIAERLREL